jgi:hypothetical protein
VGNSPKNTFFYNMVFFPTMPCTYNARSKILHIPAWCFSSSHCQRHPAITSWLMKTEKSFAPACIWAFHGMQDYVRFWVSACPFYKSQTDQHPHSLLGSDRESHHDAASCSGFHDRNLRIGEEHNCCQKKLGALLPLRHSQGKKKMGTETISS